MFKLNTKLSYYYLIISFTTPFVFGISFPITAKIKGLIFATASFGLFNMLQRGIGLIQPLIYKSKITFKQLSYIAIIIEFVWSLNIILFILQLLSPSHFIIIYIFVNTVLDVLYMSLSFKIEKIIANVEDFEKFKTVEHTGSTIAFLLVSFLVFITLKFNILTRSSLLAIAAFINVSILVVNLFIIKEYEKIDTLNDK
jgi:hypothetical protein